MKILIVRFSAIGDIVLTTPVVRCLKQQLDAEIHYITKEAYSDVLKYNPYIDKLWTIREHVREVAPSLCAEQFDWVIDLHHNLRSWQLKRLLRRPRRSFYKLNLRKWLFARLKINWLPNLHVVDRYLKTVEHLGVKNDGAGLDFPIAAEQEITEMELRAMVQDPLLRYEECVALVVGATYATKRMPPEKIAAICRELSPKVVLLLGDSTDVPAAKYVVSKSGRPGVYNLCGRLSLQGSASILRQSAVVLTHDTGLMHVAAALGKPIVSVWGNTVPAFGMYPYYAQRHQHVPSERVELTELRCRPCSKIGYNQCPEGHLRCMNDIPNERIVSAVHHCMQPEQSTHQ